MRKKNNETDKEGNSVTIMITGVWQKQKNTKTNNLLVLFFCDAIVDLRFPF